MSLHTLRVLPTRHHWNERYGGTVSELSVMEVTSDTSPFVTNVVRQNFDALREVVG